LPVRLSFDSGEQSYCFPPVGRQFRRAMAAPEEQVEAGKQGKFASLAGVMPSFFFVAPPFPYPTNLWQQHVLVGRSILTFHVVTWRRIAALRVEHNARFRIRKHNTNFFPHKMVEEGYCFRTPVFPSLLCAIHCSPCSVPCLCLCLCLFQYPFSIPSRLQHLTPKEKSRRPKKEVKEVK